MRPGSVIRGNSMEDIVKQTPHIGDPKRERESMQAFARKKLLEFFPVGSTVHVVKETSRTGANAYMRLFAIVANPDEYSDSRYWPINVTYYVGQITPYKVKDRNGENWLIMSGHGYNRADAIAETLGRILHNDPAAIKGHTL
jgi:hypothetical protein